MDFDYRIGNSPPVEMTRRLLIFEDCSHEVFSTSFLRENLAFYVFRNVSSCFDVFYVKINGFYVKINGFSRQLREIRCFLMFYVDLS